MKARVIDEILAISLADTAKARELDSEGIYTRVQPRPGHAPMRSQVRFLELAMEAEKKHLIASRPPDANVPTAPKLAPRSAQKRKKV